MSTLSMEITMTTSASMQRHTLIKCIEMDYHDIYETPLDHSELPLHTYTYEHLQLIDQMQLDDLCK